MRRDPGWRALYFLLAGLHARFTVICSKASIILGFVGIKMIVSHWFHIPTGALLAFIALSGPSRSWPSLKKSRHAEEVGEWPSLEEEVPEEPPPMQER